MAATLPGFRPASDLGPSPSEADQLRELCSRQAEQIERLEATISAESPEMLPPQQTQASLRPDEMQKLLQIISDLDARLKLVELQSEMRIKDLERDLAEAKADITWIQESFPKLIAEDRKRLAELEVGPDLTKSDAAQAHISELFEHMEAIGRKQVSFKEASRCLHISKSRALQLKPLIAVDERFILVHSESHKQKELIRLRKYFV
jgi:hypothetical protein